MFNTRGFYGSLGKQLENIFRKCCYATGNMDPKKVKWK